MRCLSRRAIAQDPSPPIPKAIANHVAYDGNSCHSAVDTELSCRPTETSPTIRPDGPYSGARAFADGAGVAGVDAQVHLAVTRDDRLVDLLADVTAGSDVCGGPGSCR